MITSQSGNQLLQLRGLMQGLAGYTVQQRAGLHRVLIVDFRS